MGLNNVKKNVSRKLSTEQRPSYTANKVHISAQKNKQKGPSVLNPLCEVVILQLACSLETLYANWTHATQTGI